MKNKTMSIILGIILLFNLLCVGTVANASEGDLTQIGNGINLYSEVKGEGNYTVVFESGYCDGTETFDYSTESMVSNWQAIQDNISKKANTIAYDRAGVKNSSDTGNIVMSEKDKIDALMGKKIDINQYGYNGTTKTARDKAMNLYELLKKKKLPAPYVIVAHSLGGYTAIEFAKMHGDELAGILFVDASGRNQLGENLEFFKNYLPEMIDPFLASFTNTDGNIDDILVSQSQVYDDNNALRNIPITFIESDPITTVGSDPIQLEAWNEMRNKQVKDILSLSNDSKRVYVPESTHYVHLSHTQLVINELNELLDTRIDINK
ncbi:alpha/beta fold hydrolase [Clostridium chrysemydis]|uniref:alpha/beta fold hydrolase n=1 Tax=Clostridium chrysemydis TaxID=2665504 RepID=UPI0018832E08|nr:alpha/beta hydrolase [Clostridium chrysemydis]